MIKIGDKTRERIIASAQIILLPTVLDRSRKRSKITCFQYRREIFNDYTESGVIWYRCFTLFWSFFFLFLLFYLRKIFYLYSTVTVFRRNCVATGKENWVIKMKPLIRCRYDRRLCLLKPKLQRHPIKSPNLKKTAQSKFPCWLPRRSVYDWNKILLFEANSDIWGSFNFLALI